MAYTPHWESLSAAAERLVKAGCSHKQAQSDICGAVSDGDIRIRAKLGKHAIRPIKSTEVISGNQLEIPTDLKLGDFDWENSRPAKPWFVRNHPRYHHGPWHLEQIELSNTDVTAKLLSSAGPTASPTVRPAKRHRGRPQREAAEIAIKTLWPDGVPPPRELPNDRLVDRVITWLKQYGLPMSGRDTILRAAGRRK
ncbi:hypothetical protein Q2941_32125 [Bradyrhizobium sp. UFLA05-153]